ncbi:MAG: GNAT family protein [Ignavibacteriaceae bacterium]|nr:GNAT family protein [Ignavibacteriaceae bacterium]
MILEICSGIKIREIIESDKHAIVRYANNKKIYNNLRDAFPFPYTFEDAENWLTLLNENIPKRAFAIANNEELIGVIGIETCRDVNRLSGELGYWLGEPFWGKGIATHAVQNFIRYAFDYYNITKIFANVFSSNPASSRVLLKSGFKLEGCMRKQIVKNGQALDQFVYGLLKDEIPGLVFKSP